MPMVYRRNAAVTNNRKWSAVNSSIYSLCFRGKASGRERCQICQSTNHPTKSCPVEDGVDVQLPAHLKAIKSALLQQRQRSLTGLDQQLRCAGFTITTNAGTRSAKIGMPAQFAMSPTFGSRQSRIGSLGARPLDHIDN